MYGVCSPFFLLITRGLAALSCAVIRWTPLPLFGPGTSGGVGKPGAETDTDLGTGAGSSPPSKPGAVSLPVRRGGGVMRAALWGGKRRVEDLRLQ